MLKSIVLNGRCVEYTLERKPVRNINLRIRRDGSVYVSAPRYVPQSSIDALLQKNAAAVLANIERAAEREARSCGAAEGEAVLLYGERYPVTAEYAPKSAVCFTGEGVTAALKTPEDGEARERVLDKWLRGECARAVNEWCERVYPVFEAMGVAWPAEIRLRRMTGRWGSCQPKNGVLTFNTALVHAPQECIEYVVIHEFAHFIHPNHSPAFHALMTRLLPDWKARRRLLNETPIDT